MSMQLKNAPQENPSAEEKPSPFESYPVPHHIYSHFRGSCNTAYSQLTDFRTAINWVVISPSDMVHFIQSQEVIYLIKIKVIKKKTALMNTPYHKRYTLYHIAGATRKQYQWRFFFFHLPPVWCKYQSTNGVPLMKDKEKKKKNNKMALNWLRQTNLVCLEMEKNMYK